MWPFIRLVTVNHCSKEFGKSLVSVSITRGIQLGLPLAISSTGVQEASIRAHKSQLTSGAEFLFKPKQWWCYGWQYTKAIFTRMWSCDETYTVEIHHDIPSLVIPTKEKFSAPLIMISFLLSFFYKFFFSLNARELLEFANNPCSMNRFNIMNYEDLFQFGSYPSLSRNGRSFCGLKWKAAKSTESSYRGFRRVVVSP